MVGGLVFPSFSVTVERALAFDRLFFAVLDSFVLFRSSSVKRRVLLAHFHRENHLQTCPAAKQAGLSRNSYKWILQN